ncbi:MAG: thiamine pyrophosphate-binding protein [Gammaproteobacteria bacterium]
MKLSDAIVGVLKQLEVGYLFGVSGANIEHLHDAVYRLGEQQLVSILSKSETGAAFMADAHARVHRQLGVCCATSGGGMMNMIVGIAESYNDSVPVLAIVGQPPSHLNGNGAFQDSSGFGRSVDALSMWKSVSKYAVTIDTPELWWDQFSHALGMALGGRPGPVALLIPRDKFELEVPACSFDLLARLKAYLPAPPDQNLIAALFAALHQASNPVLVIGQGIRRSANPAAVIAFARQTGIPVVVTPSARGEYPNDLPNFLGVCGVTGLPSVHDYLENIADLYILAGTAVDVMSSGPITKCVAKGRTTYVVNVDPSTVHITGPNIHDISGDAGMVFAYLLELQTQRPYRQNDFFYQMRWIKPILAKPIGAHTDNKLLLSAAIAVINQNMPNKGHIVIDAGNCAATALHLTQVPAAMSSTIALGMGGMGYSIGGAIGAQLGSPADTTTIAFIGDAAFLMCGLELHTAIELKLAILYIIFNNNMHGMCAVRQQLYFDARYINVNFENEVDFIGLARSLDSNSSLWTQRVTSVAELTAALHAYYAEHTGPGVLEICLGQEEIPPFLSFMTPATQFTDQLPA